MKQTLIEMVQNILSAMDSDEVNSIGDTQESMQVASIIKETYEDIISEREWPFLKTRIQLDHGNSLSKPTTLVVPNNIAKVYTFWYEGKEVCWMPPEEFLSMVNQRTENTTPEGYFNNKRPSYYTSFDDKELVCDAYNSFFEDTLMSSKTDAYVLRLPEWEMNDAYIPFLPARAFSTLLADSKGTCFINLKQQANAKEERKARKGRIMMQSEVRRVKDATPKSNSLINYGR